MSAGDHPAMPKASGVNRLLEGAHIIVCVLTIVFAAGPAKSNPKSLCETLELASQQLVEACTAVIEDPASSETDRASAYTIRGSALLQQRRYAEAVPDFDRALELQPNSFENLNNRAWTLFRWRKSTAGLGDVDKSIVLNPSYYFAWDTRAHLRQLLGDFTGAFNDYEMAIGLGGKHVIRLYQCGLVERGLYKGEVNGIYGEETRSSLKACASLAECDPLPANSDNMSDEFNCGQPIS